MDEIQAAVLNVKLKYIDEDNKKRRNIAKRYCTEITNTNITLPQYPDNELEHVWHLFVIRCSKREALQNYLAKKKYTNINTLPHPTSQTKSLYRV